LIITDRQSSVMGDTTEVSAKVDNFRLWFRVPAGYKVSETASPFLSAALLPAMLRGEKLVIDLSLSVSKRLLNNISVLQEIHHCWNPILKIIPIEARAVEETPINKGTSTFFSGGVDSTYTLLKHDSELDHLIFIQGFDFYFHKDLTPYLTINSLADLSQLAYKIVYAHDAISAYIRTRISQTTLKALIEYNRTFLPTYEIEELLIKDLNKIIGGELIYNEKRFIKTKLRPETKIFLQNKRNSNDIYKVNRLLLEDSFPLEIAKSDRDAYDIAIERNRKVAKKFEKTLIPVETNHFAFGYRYNLSRNLTQGSALASIALLLSFPCAYIPSAYSYNQLVPLGSHPLTDPLWSTEGVEIIHDGAEMHRSDKIIKIAENETFLDNLRVCFNDMNMNCGRCPKCLRTMIPLKIVGKSTVPFPPFPSIKKIKQLRVANNIELIFFKENYNLAVKMGNKEMQKAIKACINKYERRLFAQEADRVILHRIVKRIRKNQLEMNPDSVG